MEQPAVPTTEPLRRAPPPAFIRPSNEETGQMDYANALTIVSWNENGFWQADVYHNARDITQSEFECLGLAPDGFVTFSRDVGGADAFRRATDYWPGAKVVFADEDDASEEEHRHEIEVEERRQLENEEMARHFEKHPHG